MTARPGLKVFSPRIGSDPAAIGTASARLVGYSISKAGAVRKAGVSGLTADVVKDAPANCLHKQKITACRLLRRQHTLTV